MTRSHRRLLHATAAVALLSAPICSTAWGQSLGPPPRITREINMSGPRFGMTMLSQGNVDILKEHDITVRPLIAQFGWQFEKGIYNSTDGVTILSEWVPLLSGLDQGVVLPSLNWLVGARTSQGVEFGIGPNITPLGVGLVFAGGVTIRTSAVNVPLNFAIASSKSGPRVSIMTGFTLRK